MHRARDEDGKELRGRYHWLECVQAYIRYLRSKLESGDVAETKFLDARSRRMVAEAEKAELALKVVKGKLHRSEDVEFIMANRDSAIKARLLAVASRITLQVLGKTDYRQVYDLIHGEVISVLEALSSYDPAQFNEQNEAYLASLFPEPLAKTNVNGDGNGFETSESDGE